MSEKSKVTEMVDCYGSPGIALMVAKDIFAVRKGFKGKDYTSFVRFWTAVIHELERLSNV